MIDEMGKIGQGSFEQFIFNNCGYPRTEVLAGPQFGVDVSLIDLHTEMAMALTSDPLSLIPSLGLQESAWLSVHLMANDMATTGFAPMYGQFVLNLPPTLSKNDFQEYWQYVHKFSSEIKVAITGGHTGFIEGQNSTIAGGGTFVTIAPKSQILLSKYANAGDIILVTKSCAISSAAILAMSFPKVVIDKVGNEIYKLACESFYKTSSLQDALVAVSHNLDFQEVTAMHDVTEGGVLGAIYELTKASDNGAVIYYDQLPLAEVQKEICNLFDIDPRNCIGAGSMIITCKKEFVANVVSRLEARGIPCVPVGELCGKEYGMKLIKNDEVTEFEYLEKDPYWEAFFKALKRGWK
ncbi:AIR synthase family protein [Riemerella anatipestifer]|uniref:Hydrogenase maturation factor n=2 Tax=Riemerella anatipestifer TaxID=34085 RepID=J9QTL4_RIEAN|nr:AIR synthase family protein [Riemerella anatipestifer]AFR36121.1 hypothetical protein B739_1529 [Riemerella anatipestifer RA-CH-1]AIH03121.1 Hydrogenase maturation factor [Riemerella anatipestifer CH3]MCU7582272.1 AIR synthase family protein [Riemerella anatipestifer]MDD1549037.1 AIR synthase [Riemerella anatipestifer]MDD1550446.1 AIR synthase [Riemerella anatipestifer]